MDILQDLLTDKLLFPAVRLFCSTNVSFSNDRIRRLFSCKVVKLIHLLGCRVGVENVKRHLSSAILRVFCTFNVLYDFDENITGSPVKLAQSPPKQVRQSKSINPACCLAGIHIHSIICQASPPQLLLDLFQTVYNQRPTKYTTNSSTGCHEPRFSHCI